jgi:hypothetical protein
LLSVLWLYNRTGDEKLLDLTRVLGAQGRDWKAQFAEFKFTSKDQPWRSKERRSGLRGRSALAEPALPIVFRFDPAGRKSRRPHQAEALDVRNGGRPRAKDSQNK